MSIPIDTPIECSVDNQLCDLELSEHIAECRSVLQTVMDRSKGEEEYPLIRLGLKGRALEEEIAKTGLFPSSLYLFLLPKNRRFTAINSLPIVVLD
jgi:hypothetical protein